jgi:ubiquinone/menaquinone biosynthesis C-methylase UbiE
MKPSAPALKVSVPKPVKSYLKQLYLGALDLTDGAARRRDMTPPRNLRRFVGDGDFKAIGLEFMRIFVEFGGLKSDDRVLDVGCGTGRLAAPLTGYLSVKGEYQGLDIVRKGVEWCQNNITARHPNFQFRHSDIHNKNYNPHGVIQASNYKFPYENSSFDFIFLTSVFTHLLPQDMEHYLSEISRVLKKGGTSLITFFLINEESRGLALKKMSTQNFDHEIDGYLTASVENPEAAIAFPEPYIRGSFGKVGLSICEPIHYGSWSGRERFLSYQDVVIARKE